VRKSIGVFLLAVLAMMALTRSASSGESVDDQVKHLAQRYKQVEDQLRRSIHYIRKTESRYDGGTTIEQAWFNGAGDLIKVAVERIDSSGRELTEYFAPDFDNADDGMFILTRKETLSSNGGTQVDESRQYFDGELIRELRKSARFKSGESTDTVHVPNVVVDLSKQPKDNHSEGERAQAAYDFFSKPLKIATTLKEAGPPDVDPFASVKGDSEKFRVIHGTASPDGRYAIALGFTREKIDWEQLKDSNNPATYFAEDYISDEAGTVDSENGKLLNYVVDLTTGHILGETGCAFFGTKSHYNYRACGVSWSPDSKTFVQLTSEKWNYVSCRAGRITAGPKLVGTVDLGKYAEKNASSYLKAHKHGKYEGSIDIGIDNVTDDGIISLTIYGQKASGDRKGELNFSVAEKIRMRETPAGLRLETVSVRNAPEE
jgi:hypothetical protein